MVDISTILEEGGLVAGILITILIIFKLCRKYHVHTKFCGISIDFRKTATRQKEIESESALKIRNLKLEEMSLRVRERELTLETLKLQISNKTSEKSVESPDENV